MNAAPVMEVFHTSFLIPLMSNEIENFSFSAGRLSFIFRCKDFVFVSGGNDQVPIVWAAGVSA